MRFLEKKKVRVGKIKKTEDGEWMVPVYVDGKFNDDMTYYAGEGAEAKKDAEGTRDQIIKDMKNSNEYEFTEEVDNEEPNLLIIDEEIEIKQGDSILILEKGDKIRVLEDEKFNYMMLDRLRQDCIYAINQSKGTKQLWGKTVDGHIAEMRKLYNMVREKPEWLTPEDIDMYEKELKKLEKAGK